MQTFIRYVAWLVFVPALFMPLLDSRRASADSPIEKTIAQTQPRMVKIHGAGGFRGLESYQSGMLISADGHVLTVFSYVLDTEPIRVVLGDGRRFEAKLLGADPHLEVAVLKIDATGLPHFTLAESVDIAPATRVLAFSNLFGVATGDEPISIQHGVVATRTTLAAHRGTFETPYHGPVYVIDATTNNPGAAGGALVTRQGELAGMLGKELRNASNHTWLNYAMPIPQISASVDEILAGRFSPMTQERVKPAQSLTPAMLGIQLVPDVVERTPPYIDRVSADSPAAAVGLRPDDLIVLLNDQLIQSRRALEEALSFIDYEDPIMLSVLRGNDLKQVEVQRFVDQGGNRDHEEGDLSP